MVTAVPQPLQDSIFCLASNAFLRIDPGFWRRSSVTGSERVVVPSEAMVQCRKRFEVTEQFPGLLLTLYPKQLATMPTSFFSMDAIWLDFQVHPTNKTPAKSGGNYFSVSPRRGFHCIRMPAFIHTEPIRSPVIPHRTCGSILQTCRDEWRSNRP